MATTALALITGAYNKLGVIALGEPLPAALAAEGFRLLNQMMGALQLQTLTKPVQARLVFPLVADKGGPANPYTIGPSGDFNTVRPTVQDVVGVGLLLAGSTPPIEIPRDLLTDDQYEAIRVKDLSNSLFTALYYNATYIGGFGRIHLWPVPNTGLHSLVLYLMQSLASFSTLTGNYETPPGLDEPLEYNLVIRLAGPNMRQVPIEIWNPLAPEKGLAATSLANFKRANTVLTDLASDATFATRGGSRGFNILSGTGG